jgi:hypothetical protein
MRNGSRIVREPKQLFAFFQNRWLPVNNPHISHHCPAKIHCLCRRSYQNHQTVFVIVSTAPSKLDWLFSNRVFGARLQSQRLKHLGASVLSAYGRKSKPPALRLAVDAMPGDCKIQAAVAKWDTCRCCWDIYKNASILWK